MLRRPCLAAALLAAAVLFPVSPLHAEVDEPQLSEAEVQRLGTLEAHSINEADGYFADTKDRDLDRAAAEYDAFILQFPKSDLIAYALLRKGRALHLQDRRFAAMKEYNEVLDYFPNDIKYAGAALYYLGLANQQNGDTDEALKAWAEMAEDEDYSQHPFAADAIIRLADVLNERGQRDKAVQYWRQVATQFRTKSPDEAHDAIWRVVPHYIRTQPDEEELRAFYEETRTFDGKPQRVEGEVLDSRDYWNDVMRSVERYGRFEDEQKPQRDAYYQYWAGKMSGRFEDWDDYQLRLADYQRVYEGSFDAWASRLDAQFERNMKPGDHDRIIDWIRLFREDKEKVREYYQKLDFSKMSNAQTQRLMEIMYSDVKDADLGRLTFDKLKLDEMSDDALDRLGGFFEGKDEPLVERAYLSMNDKTRGKMELLVYYHKRKVTEKGLKLAEEMVTVPDAANEAYMLQGKLLMQDQQWDPAIASFSQYGGKDEDPEHLWLIAECLMKLGRVDPAIQQLSEIENFFQKVSSRASLKVADYFNASKQNDKYVAALRATVRKYPRTREGSEAHNRLESMGLKTGGGVE